jgi:hypothetical protein
MMGFLIETVGEVIEFVFGKLHEFLVVWDGWSFM